MVESRERRSRPQPLTDLVLLDLVLGPSILVLLVQVDGLEHVVLKRFVLQWSQKRGAERAGAHCRVCPTLSSWYWNAEQSKHISYPTISFYAELHMHDPSKDTSEHLQACEDPWVFL